MEKIENAQESFLHVLECDPSYLKSDWAVMLGIKEIPNLTDDYYNSKGLQYFYTGDYKKAEKNFNKALEINPKNSLRKKILIMRACGYFLLLLNLVVSVMIFLLIYTAPYAKYHEIIVITLATYTFSALTIAIVNIVKYLKKNEYVYSCVKMISLISASVSMLTLTNTMLATFGSENELLRSIILPILSGVVAIFIIVCAILMIKKANNDLKVLKNE